MPPTDASPPGPTAIRSRSWLLMIVLFCLTSGPGCMMHRRMTINSDPPGALVLMEGKELGYTPCSVDFTYYGTREITLVKDGYETLTVLQKVKTPWYQYFPLEFVTDNLVPAKINDRHAFTYRMNRQELVPSQELLDRAKGLRAAAQMQPVEDP